MKASVFYVDMDGLHDGQAIKTIISDLQPRKLVSGQVSAFELPAKYRYRSWFVRLQRLQSRLYHLSKVHT